MTVDLDITAPTVTITTDSQNLGIAETANLTFVFSEPVYGFADLTDISVTNGGDISNLASSSATTYTATYTPPEDAVATADINIVAWSAKDKHGNGTLATTTPLAIAYDTALSAPNSVALSTASDYGASPTDNITGDTTPTITGCIAPYPLSLIHI